MFGKFKVENQVCYMSNSLALVNLSESKIGDIVKLYRYETEEELYMVAVENPRVTGGILWDTIINQETFDLYQFFGSIPGYEELCFKTLYNERTFFSKEDCEYINNMYEKLEVA